MHGYELISKNYSILFPENNEANAPMLADPSIISDSGTFLSRHDNTISPIRDEILIKPKIIIAAKYSGRFDFVAFIGKIHLRVYIINYEKTTFV